MTSAAAQQTDAVHTANAASGDDVTSHDAATSAHLVTSRDAEVETRSQSEDEDDDAVKRSYNEILASQTFVKARKASDSSVRQIEMFIHFNHWDTTMSAIFSYTGI